MPFTSFFVNLDQKEGKKSKWLAGSLLTGSLALGTFLFSRYKVAPANKYIVVTGLFIKDIKVAKKSFILPFQKYQMVEVNPKSYKIILNNMSKEKVEYKLPVVFTIAPHFPETHLDLFKNYARTMTGSHDNEAIVETTVTSVVHGESRILSATMDIEELFSDRSKFKSMVSDKIAKDLEQFGLRICNANIEEMHDTPGNLYFSNLKKKALSGADNQSRIEVAEAEKNGDIGVQERKAETVQRIAQLEADTIKVKNERDRDIAESTKTLEVSKAEYNKQKELARIEAEMAAKQKEVEWQREIELRRVETEKETIRATDLSKATVAAESAVVKAQGEAAARQKEADADLYVQQRKAEALMKMAEANLYSEQKKAEGLNKVYEAEALGLQQILKACDGNANLYQFRLAINANLFPQLARENASAIKGLNPKINIWNTGADSSNGNAFKPITDVVKMVPPLLEVLNTQTNIKFPEALGGNKKSNDSFSNSTKENNNNENIPSDKKSDIDNLINIATSVGLLKK